MKTKSFLFAALILPLALASSAFAAADTYQVTGPILAITDNSLIVEKNGERWEIARDANTKSDRALKVGEKVTVHYRMFATTIESKPAGSSGTSSSSKENKADRSPSSSAKEKSK